MCKKCKELKERIREVRSMLGESQVQTVYWIEKFYDDSFDSGIVRTPDRKTIIALLKEKLNKRNPSKKTPPQQDRSAETKSFRALLDNPKDLWEDLNGLEGGAQ